MTNRPVALMSLALGAAVIASPLAAEPKSQETRDLNEVVCEKQTIVGSRLATRRVCATRAEWAEKRRLDREAIDQGQRSACMITTTGSKGHASCY